MQGQLSEIDIRSILQLIELGQRTGELFVQAYASPAVTGGRWSSDDREVPSFDRRSWFVFFLNGRIVYAGESNTDLSRLRDYLRRYQAEAALDTLSTDAIATFNTPEYGYFWALLENHALTPAQGRAIIQNMVQETLFDLLNLQQGSFICELGTPLTPQLMTLEIAPLATRMLKQVQEWKQLRPQIQSPTQCPVLTDVAQLQASLPHHTFQVLDRYADGRTSLQQMARYLNRDILTVARAIYPYVQRGWLTLTSHPCEDTGVLRSPLECWQPPRIPKVVCIDDGVTVRKTVEVILERQGYQVDTIGDPLKALSLVFPLKPDLILCDIAMPDLDGYELCAMLRQSSVFRQTPIVMLTGKEGFIDRVKARIIGATDYLTKPFGESELLMLVEKYVGRGHPDADPMNQKNVLTSEEVSVNIT